MIQSRTSRTGNCWWSSLFVLLILMGLSGCAHTQCGEDGTCPSVSCKVKKCFLFHHDKCSPKPYWSFEGYQTDLDKYFVRHAARKCAKQSLKSMSCNCKDKPSKSFRKGYQQAYIDIALGESGTVPPVPPEEYWAAHYRTPEGYMVVQEWFTGYKLGAEQALASGHYDYNQIATPYSLAGWVEPAPTEWGGDAGYQQNSYPEESLTPQVAPAPAVTPPPVVPPKTTVPPPPPVAPRTPLKTVPQKRIPRPVPVQPPAQKKIEAHPRPMTPQPNTKPSTPIPAPRPPLHTPLPKQSNKPALPQRSQPAQSPYINDDPPPSPYSLQAYPYTPLPDRTTEPVNQGHIKQIENQQTTGQQVIENYYQKYPGKY